jgi:lipid A 4'-phosphatase
LPDRRGLALYGAAFAAAAAFFTLLPQLDLWTSGLFYRPGEAFFLADDFALRAVYWLVRYVAVALAIGLPLLLIMALWLRQPVLGLDRRALIFLIAALVIGPGLVVNTVLKDHWGRARPSQIEEYGGAKQFTPALEPTDQCERNCSFPAGHPAIGFYFVAFAAVIAAPRPRRLVFAGAIAAGAILGIMRIAQGGHFLSDVVFSGLIVVGVNWLLYEAIVRHAGRATSSPARRLALTAILCAIAASLSMAFYDRPIAIAVHDIDPRIHGWLEFITQFGLSKGYLILAGLLFIGFQVAGAYLARPEWRSLCRIAAWRAAFVFLALAISGIAVDLLKLVFGRARPKLLFLDQQYGFTWHGSGPDVWSFPSGHAASATALALALTVVWPRFWPLYWIYAALILASRVLLDAHYLSDLIGGAFIAYLCVRALQVGFARCAIPLSGNP